MLRWVLILLLAPALHAELTGTWSGVLEVTGTKLRVVLKFEGNTAKLGSPDQTADEFPADEVTVEGDRVRVVVRKIQAEYAGRVDGDTIEGEWRQPGIALPLRMQRVQKVAKLRPQEPDAPLPYDAREVCWTAAVRLCGTLTAPKEQPRVALVLLATWPCATACSTAKISSSTKSWSPSGRPTPPGSPRTCASTPPASSRA
jgi:hypothetical protein